MRALIVASAVLISLASAVSARADASFTSPGWYEIAVSDLDVYLAAGPYADEASCQAKLLPDADGYVDHCEYLSANPDWNF